MKVIMYGIGIVLIVLGIYFGLNLNREIPSSETMPTDANENSIVEFSPAEGYYEGTLTIDGKPYPIQYRRLTRPIQIGENFTWPRQLDRSALDSALSIVSHIFHGISEEEYYQYYADVDKIKRSVDSSLESLNASNFEEYIIYAKEVFKNSSVLGEVKYKDCILVVFDLDTEGRDVVIRLGATIRLVENKYLRAMGLEQGSDDMGKVLRQLSADDYSILLERE